MIQTQLRVTSSFLVLQAQRGFWEGRPGGLGQWFSFCFALYDATTWYAGSKEEEADDPSFQGLWQHRPDNLNKTSSQPFSSGQTAACSISATTNHCTRLLRSITVHEQQANMHLAMRVSSTSWLVCISFEVQICMCCHMCLNRSISFYTNM